MATIIGRLAHMETTFEAKKLNCILPIPVCWKGGGGPESSSSPFLLFRSDSSSTSQITNVQTCRTQQIYHGVSCASWPTRFARDSSFLVSLPLRIYRSSVNAKLRCTPSLQALKSETESSRITVDSDEGGSEDGDDKDEDEDDAYESDLEAEIENVIHETWTMFEWPAMCAQVAQFATTPMGISLAKGADLAIGASQSESEELLKQTADAAALAAALDFSGIKDIREIIGAAMSGIVCQTDDLCTVKATLTRIRSLYDQLGLPAKSGQLSSLQALLTDCDLCSNVISEIEFCLDCKLATVLDRASPKLADVRHQREQNMKVLETLLRDTASWVIQKGGMDSVIVTLRRKRLCIAVRTSHKSLLAGGVVLDVSNTGTTSFMEPEPALILNNEENRLASKEREEELAVLEKLTLKLIDKADEIMDLLERVTVLDLACARGAHARWLDSVCPVFSSSLESLHSTVEQKPVDRRKSPERSGGGSDEGLLLSIDSLRHPILLGNALPIPPSSPRHGQLPRPRASNGIQDDTSLHDSKGKKRLVPVDIKVKDNIRVVTITGPNTGGKTATLKAIGVAAIMAKAGMFLPAQGQPKLPWFDLVLADIGDSQSLERSLSTFSGHIRRLCAILELCTDRSLVLLDEVGGGTDPAEGASLARAVLQHFCSTVGLTIATTHSAELKLLREQDSRFENASVEFDLATLRPTYRVLWGVAGQSNALDIAENLGFNQAVMGRARELVGKLRQSELGVQTEGILEALVEQRDGLIGRAIEAERVLVKASSLHKELKDAVENLAKRESSQRNQDERLSQREVTSAQFRMNEVVEKFQEAEEQAEQDDRNLLREAQAEISTIVEEFKPLQSESIPEFYPGETHEQLSVTEGLSVGDEVLVKRLGKAPVTVKELPRKDSENFTVQLGTLKLQVKPTELLKIKREGRPSPATARAGKITPQSKGLAKNQTDEHEVSSEPKYEVAVRTSRNTLDLRGQRVDDATRELNLSLASKRPQSVMFVVHGVGTGALKEAVHRILRTHSLVAKFEDESLTNAGCTIVYIK